MAQLLKHNLLIVDDDEDTRRLLTQIFIARGLNVRIAKDGFEALERIRNGRPEILLSDLNMPGMSGFELLSVVRRLYPEIYVIAMSGAYAGPRVPTGIAADGYHEKATGVAQLFERIAAASDDAMAHASLVRRATPPWVDLERRYPLEGPHVLINCPECLRGFPQAITEVHSEIRSTKCVHCDATVPYALALAIDPALDQGMGHKAPQRDHTPIADGTNYSYQGRPASR